MMADTKINAVLAALQAQGLEISRHASDTMLKGWIVGDAQNFDLISPNGYVYDAKTTKAMLELGYISTNVSANKEYMCEYCATANAKENTTCSQCGAPRSFVIG